MQQTVAAYRVPKPQEKQSTSVEDYKHIVVVFGTRGYSDRKQFHEELMNYLDLFEGEPVLFVSGAAKSGADDLIIRWCKKYKYPCKLMPADWDTHGKAAGFIRNTEMAKIATHGLGFWDGESRGTKQMKDELKYYELSFRIVKIDVAANFRQPTIHPDPCLADIPNGVNNEVSSIHLH